MAERQLELRSADALYKQIIERLTSEIESGSFKEGDMLPSEGDIAKKYEVSNGTAKMALNKLAELGVVKRVPRVGTFIASKTELAPIAKRERTRVTLVVPCLPDSYMRSIVEGVERVARQSGVDVIFRMTDENEDEERRLLRTMLSQDDTSGLIIFPVNGLVCCDELLQLKLSGHPVVVVDREYRGIEVDSVVPDHFNGAKDVISYLAGLGHRKIGFVSLDISSCSASESRYRGYVEGLAENGIRLDSSLVIKEGIFRLGTPGQNTDFNGPLLSYFRQHQDVTAVFCANDFIAVSTIEAALSLGMDVPGSLSVVGFSDNEYCNRSPVGVTTVAHGQAVAGEYAMDLLLKRLSDPSRPHERVCLSTKLVVRGSSGSPCS